MATATSLVVLGAVLALVAWGRLPDVAVGVPAALVVLALGLVDLGDVGDTFDRLGPTLAFLAAIFVFAELARDAGIFDATGALLAARSGTSRRLVVAVSAAAVVMTVLMSLDATAVLFSRGVRRPRCWRCSSASTSAPTSPTPGSLATLLWRRVVRGAGVEPSRGAFVRTAVLATPVALVLATVMLWLSLQVSG